MTDTNHNELRRPRIICLCGSTRFGDAFAKALLEETLAGNIVLTVGCDTHSDDQLFAKMDLAERRLLKAKLDVLHFHKIMIADEVFILNVGGYIGESTEREICWAESLGKSIRYLEDPNGKD